MFVASRVYNYATGNSSVASSSKSNHHHHEPTPANTRVKRHPKKIHNHQRHSHHHHAPPSYATVLESEKATKVGEEELQEEIQQKSFERSEAEKAKIKVVDEIIQKEELYEILGVSRKAKMEEIRRGFLNRSRICHPDKLPNYPACVVAFQKVSFAYQTLSKPSSRKIYDVSGRQDLASAMMNQRSPTGDPNDFYANQSDETLNGVLYSVFCEFLEGDFEMIRVLVNALNEGNPGLDLGDDAVNNIEGAFKKLRELLLAGKKYLTIVRFELIRLYEIQHSLRQLSYFDVFGRLRLTLQLARVTLSIPMAIDQAMKEPEVGSEQQKHAGLDDVKEEGGDVNEINLTSSDEDSQDDDDNDEGSGRRRRRRQTSVEEEFGMRAEDEEEDEEEENDYTHDIHPTLHKTKHSSRSSARRRAARRLRARKKAELEAKEAEISQKRGLLGPTAAGLLQGVVKVLETGERWVPGGGAGKTTTEDDDKIRTEEQVKS